MFSYLRPVSAVAGVFFLLACAPADDRTDDTLAIDTAPITLSPADEPGAPGTEPAPAPGTRTVHVVLTEWGVAPSQTSFPAGPVQFHVMNEGQFNHALHIERGTDSWMTQSIPPGGTGSVVVTTTPGTYTLYCPIVDAQGNHRQRGMQTTVTVQ